MVTVECRLVVRPRELLGWPDRRMEELIVGEVRKGRPFTDFDRGVFHTQHQSPYFRVRAPNERSTKKFSRSKLPPLDCCIQRLPDILAFGTLVLEPFRKRFLLFGIPAGARSQLWCHNGFINYRPPLATCHGEWAETSELLLDRQDREPFRSLRHPSRASADKSELPGKPRRGPLPCSTLCNGFHVAPPFSGKPR